MLHKLEHKNVEKTVPVPVYRVPVYPRLSGRNFGHLAYAVENIYDYCKRLMELGVVINRPPRDGRMAFIKSPDGISIELLQIGEALAPQEPWISALNTGTW